MKRLLALLAAVLLIPCLSLAEETVRTEGAEIGEWTQDWDAAIALSKEKDVPVFVLFTGSDWCPYCVKLHDRIFSQPGWADWAKDKLVMVYLDFPKDESKVPEKYRERNEKLGEQYGVEGYPTAFLLTVDDLQNVAAFGYDDSDTPESFAKDVDELLPVAKRGGLQKTFSEKEWAQFQEATGKYAKLNEEIQKMNADLEARVKALTAMGKDRKEIIELVKEDVEKMMALQKKQTAAEKVRAALMRRALQRMMEPEKP